MNREVGSTNAEGSADPRIPTAGEPSSAVLKKLQAVERLRLKRLLGKPFEYIHHPSFDTAGTGQKLFAEDFTVQAHSTRPWCNAAEIDAIEFDPSLLKPITLTTPQEQTLFLRLNYARFRIDRLLTRFAHKQLSEQATHEILWWQNKVERLRGEIVKANVPLVLAMAKRTRLGNIDYAELISEGNMALLRSVDKFDCSRGFKFSTYGCRAILKSFSRVAMKIGRYRGRFPVEFDPTLERSDFADHQHDTVTTDCLDELRGILRENSASLNDVEVKVIQARFALGNVQGAPGDGPQTLEQVGMLIGVTKERVRQIQNRALSKLREKLQKDFLAA
ncbi:MAG TPA: sigma-70 family RNA polymerase sigma factor [Phycisphaerae bacterium]|nr:sigma-70 family RNA polymerase sigma factor [Phycisphaerae bacterium]